MTTKLSTTNFSASALASINVPTISAIQVTDSSYNVINATAVSVTGGYIKITGSGFVTGALVYIDSTPSTSVTFVSATQLNVQVPATTSNSYVVYVINPDGSVAIRVNGISFSSTPTWSTSSSQSTGATVNIQLTASSDSTITYTLADGSTLPDGLSLSTSGLLSGVVSGSSTVVYNFSVVATDLETQTSTQAFSVTVTFNDPYFRYNTLVLNGETSVTPFIKDASTNNFGLTIAGDTSPNKFSPYYGSGYYSMSCAGASDYLNFATANTTLGTSNFTIEFWFYRVGYGGSYDILTNLAYSTNNGPYTALQIQQGSLGATFLVGNGSSAWSVNIGLTAPAQNTWAHYAFVRSGNTFSAFINGTRQGTATSAVSIPATASGIQIGYTYYGAVSTTNGYFSNYRVVNGTAVYDPTLTTLTVPTSPLTAISGTVLLTCHNSRFSDSSSNNYIATIGGVPKITTFIPFALNSSYSTYGSGYFDGTGDYLSIPDSPALQFGASDFTVECWFNIPDLATNRALLNLCATGTTNYIAAIYLFRTAANVIRLQVSENGTTFLTSVDSSVLASDTWHHVAVVRNGQTISLFINGTSAGSVTTTTAGTALTNGIYHYIGTSRTTTGTARDYYGYISDVRIIKGAALYSTTFSPPTTPLTAVANTQLLTLQYNGSVSNNVFIDNASPNSTITRFANASQGTFSPYSQTGWSTYYNGTTDYHALATNAAFAIGTADFTVECWVNPLNTTRVWGTIFAGVNYGSASDWGLYAGDGTNALYPMFFFTSASTPGVGASSTQGNFSLTSNTQLVVGVWSHIAVSRISGIAKMFINGTQVGVSVTATSWSLANTLQKGIGGGFNGNANSLFPGYISNLRVVSGTGLYNTAFTPPTSPLTPIEKTILLTNQSNAFTDSSSNNFTLTTGGTPSIQAFSPFSGLTSVPTSYSNYFGAQNTYIRTANNTNTVPGTGDFTIEGWFFFTASVANNQAMFNLGAYDNGILIRGYNSGFDVWINNTQIYNVVGSGSYTINAWYHIALTRQSTSLKLFLNGTQLGTTATNSMNITASGAPNYLLGTSAHAATSDNTIGYLSNWRVIKGQSLYNESFTPSTSPLTKTTVGSTGAGAASSISGTVELLTLQNNTIIDNSYNNATITVTGTVLARPFNPFGTTTTTGVLYSPAAVGGSVYLDGTGDYLQSAANAAIVLGTNNFTIDFWIYNLDTSDRYIFLVGADWPANTGVCVLHYLGGYALGGPGTSVTGQGTVPTPNQWTHLAVVRNGTSYYLYKNGVQIGSLAVATNPATDNFVKLGTGTAASWPMFKGYIADLRIINGTCLYTSNFYPPIAPLPITTQTVFALPFTSGGIIDYHSSNVLETVGNTQLSTSVKKNGNSSIYFDGTGDYLNIPAGNSILQLVTGDFTVEFWMYGTSISSTCALIDSRNPDTANIAFDISLTSSSLRFTTSGTAFITGGTTLSNSVWYHVALTRSGNTFKLFLNGVQEGTTYTGSSTQNFTNTNFRIGSGANGAFTGYIDDLRITKGIARYTGTFTPPGTPLLN